MDAVTARATPGMLIQLDQCDQCGGIWCDKWELFPLDPEEAERLDPVDEDLLRDKIRLPQKTLYCPRCADALEVFADPILPQDIQLNRCRHCDGLWLNRGQFRRYKEYQKTTRAKRWGKKKRVAALAQAYADPQSWVVTGTKGIFAYPRAAQDDDLLDKSLADTMKLVLQSLVRMVLGV